MADTQVLEACAVRRRGSSPLSRTRHCDGIAPTKFLRRGHVRVRPTFSPQPCPRGRRSERRLMSQTITQPDNTRITLEKTADYRDSYANSVQVRLSVWDFLLVFGRLNSELAQSPEHVRIDNFQGIYLSPQQAKALFNVLGHNLAQYEQAFGPISLDSSVSGNSNFSGPGSGPVH